MNAGPSIPGESDSRPVLTRPSAVRELLLQIGHRPNKGLGQNYLIDANILAILIHAAAINEGETILEVGPGLGTLTQALLRSGAAVTAVEKDPAMARHLRSLFPEINLLEADVLDVDLNRLFASGIRTVAANLPYSAGSRFIVNVLESHPLPERMVFMVQKEVAERLTAKPGCKAYGPLAIWSQRHYSVEIVKTVSPTCFMPAPKVWSAIVRFSKRPNPLASVADEARFKHLVKLCFTQRRKQIGTILRNNAPEFLAGMSTAGIEPQRRPEQLSIEQWAALANGEKIESE